MTLIRKLKKLVSPLSNTPIHPQWIVSSNSHHLLTTLKQIKNNSTILDIGCYSKWPQKIIPDDCRYIGLDYYETARNWYQSIPDLYGDALSLPIKKNSIDIILLLDVLEHLPDTQKVLEETNKVLKDNGELIIQVPFLYPLHDEPRDYYRFTKHGFKILAEKNNFKLIECKAIGQPIETSALLTNLALVKSGLNLITSKNPLMIITILFPFFILINNLLAKAFSFISDKEQFMPYSYLVILKKTE